MQSSPQSLAPADEALAALIAHRADSETARLAAQDAFGQLYRRHARPLLAFLAARVHRDELEDILQEVWKRIWQHLPGKFRGGNFRAWVYQIARNFVIDLRRKPASETLPDEQELPNPHHGNPDEPVLEKERQMILKRCLEKLCAEAAGLVRARLSGTSYADVCQQMGLQPARAHKLFHLAKEQLQTCVERALT